MGVGLALAAILLPAASTARASPWTLKRGQGVLSATYLYQTADSEWFSRDDTRFRSARPFPLRGRYDATTVQVGARVGVTDALEFELGVPFRLVSYSSDPVLLLPNDPPAPTAAEELDAYQANVVNLGRSVTGLGDVSATARLRVLPQPVALATELRLKIPTGYRGPEGTFGARPTSVAEFLENPAIYARPENVRDDVTLGDGQVDAALSLLAGYALPSRTFFRLDLGYNLRFGGAADQLLVSLRAGQLVAERVLVYAGISLAYATERGRVIGVSVAAEDPELPAQEYAGLSNLYLREVRLERDALDVALGAILKVTDTTELNAAFVRTVWGNNTAVTGALVLSVAVRSDWFGDVAAAAGAAASSAESAEQARVAAEAARAAAEEARAAAAEARAAAERAGALQAPEP
jgi:hypothetical protein